MKILQMKINLRQIDKLKIYEGKNGDYIDCTVFLREETDQFGNDGFIAQNVTKEQYKAGQRGNILGNVKWSKPQNTTVKPDHTENDLPF